MNSNTVSEDGVTSTPVLSAEMNELWNLVKSYLSEAGLHQVYSRYPEFRADIDYILANRP